MKRIGVLAAIALAAVFVSGAGGGTAKVDLSTRAGVEQYLAAHGIDPTGMVIQRGARNYAGPSCPGKGWTCSRAARVVQISSDSENKFQCTPSSGGLVAAPDSCTIVQIASGGRNDARCYERSSQPVVTQSCTITQQNTTGENRADVRQTVDVGPGNNNDGNNNNGNNNNGNNNSGNGHQDVRRLAAVRDASTETATQTASVKQTNGSGPNTSRLSQDVSQRSKTTDAAGMQSQDSHQSATVQQTADTGGNASTVDQSLAQRANAAGGATVTQAQNGQPGGPNTDALINQSTTLGRNVSSLNQSHDLRMQSKRIATATQTQSTPTGGLNGHVDQLSAGLSVSINLQDERQWMDADDTTTQPSQTQYGPSFCCSIQQSNPGDVFRIGQRSRQTADPGASQSNAVVGNCDTSGNCTVNQLVQQNSSTTPNSCTGQHCHTGIVIRDGEIVLCNVDSCPPAPGSTFRLTVVPVGNGGTDTVTSQPGTIDCGPPAHNSCTADYAPGTVVQLTALTRCDFGNGTWIGADSSDGNLAFVTMNANKTVTAQYGSAC